MPAAAPTATRAPERDVGGYDGTAFWTRSGMGYALTPEELGGALGQGIPAFGDSIGGMFIAGGISAALLHRERTGEALEVDVSLLSTAWWAAGASVTQGMETGEVMRTSHARIRGPVSESLHGQLLNLRRRHDQPVHHQPDRANPRHLRAPRHPRGRRRSPLRRRAAVDPERRRGSRADREGLRRQAV